LAKKQKLGRLLLKKRSVRKLDDAAARKVVGGNAGDTTGVDGDDPPGLTDQWCSVKITTHQAGASNTCRD